MRVVFDQKLMAGNYPAAATSFLLDLIKEMAELSPMDEFIVLTMRPPGKHSGLPPNMSLVEIRDPGRHLLTARLFEMLRLPRIVKRLEPDVYVAVDNPRLSVFAKCNVMLLLDPMAGKEGKQTNTTQGHKIWRSLNEVTAVFSFSSNSLPDGNTSALVLPLPFPPKLPEFSWAQKENIKVQYAGGYDYFLFAGDLNQRYRLLDLLKAFSSFKKWQGSGMRLLLAGARSESTNELQRQLETYKYRADVSLISDPETEVLNNLMGAAYAFVYPASNDPLPINILRAVAAGLPVISTESPVIKEWFGDTVLYVQEPLPDSFSAAMQLLFKDEAKSQQLVAAATTLMTANAEQPAQFLLKHLSKLSQAK